MIALNALYDVVLLRISPTLLIRGLLDALCVRNNLSIYISLAEALRRVVVWKDVDVERLVRVLVKVKKGNESESDSQRY